MGLHVTLVIVCVLALLITGTQNGPGGFFVNVLAAAVVVILEGLVITRRRLKLLLHTRFRKDRVRLSFSYLIRICVKNKYLLVRSHRMPDQYQPVGGVYKTVPGGVAELRRLGARNDDKMAYEDGDLRINVLSNVVVHVVDWFDTNSQRESTPIREFVEELIDDGIIALEDHEKFRWAFFSFVGKNNTGIQFSDHFGMRELLIADIYELIPTPEQQAALLRVQNSDRARWFTAEEIEQHGHTGSGEAGYRIAPHSRKILPAVSE